MKPEKSPKSAPFLVQFGIYAAILFVANILSSLFPPNFPVPATVIGLILLYLLLTFHVIKLSWVDSLGSFLISIIGFLFVPSGISLAANLKLMQQEGVQVVLVIIASTFILLIVTAYTTRLLIACRKKLTQLKESKSNNNSLNHHEMGSIK